MRRLHIPFMLLVTLFLVGHFGPRLHDSLTNLTEVTHAQGYPTCNHYAPQEDLERLDMEALNYLDTEARRSGGQTLDICMYSLTDRRLAAKLRELAERGVTERIYRDGKEYEEEQQRARRHGSAMGLLIGRPNIHIRVKPASRTVLMHLKAYCVSRAMLRDGSANWSPPGEAIQDNSARFSADPQEIRDFERTFEVLWNRPENIRVQ